MNQIVDVEKLVSAVPLDKPAVKKMTRSEKLLHWAGLVRKRPGVRLYHGLEYYNQSMLNHPIDTAHNGNGLFSIALNDAVLREQGLTGTPTGNDTTISTQQIMDFFELSQAELHVFSCDCGGTMTGRGIAERMESLAGRAPRVTTPAAAVMSNAPTFADRVRGLFR